MSRHKEQTGKQTKAKKKKIQGSQHTLHFLLPPRALRQTHTHARTHILYSYTHTHTHFLSLCLCSLQLSNTEDASNQARFSAQIQGLVCFYKIEHDSPVLSSSFQSLASSHIIATSSPSLSCPGPVNLLQPLYHFFLSLARLVVAAYTRPLYATIWARALMLSWYRAWWKPIRQSSAV